MWLVHIFLCLYLVFLADSEAFVEQFLFNETSPKCCKIDEILSVASSGNLTDYSCESDLNRTVEVLTKEILENFPLNLSEIAISCVDYTLEEETGRRIAVKLDVESSQLTQLKLSNSSSNFFPKCCPVNFAYDTFEHKCEQISNETDAYYLSFAEEYLAEHLERGLFFLKPGLAECDTVIADYELPSFDERSFDADKGVFLNSLNKTFAYGSYCVDKVHNSESYVARVCHENFSICKKRDDDDERIRCIRKCCPDGNVYRGGGKCKFDFAHGLNFGNDSRVRDLDESFAVVHGHSCRKYPAKPFWNYTLDEMGNLKLLLEEDKTVHSPFTQSYCFEHVDFGVIQGTRLFLCFAYKDKDRIEYQITRVALLFSCIFLILTLLGYIFLPEIQNLHGKTLMCHCVTLLVAFIVLVVLQFHPNLGENLCKASGYILIYTFLAAFMWSNIMCFDIWWTFGSMKVQGIHQKKKELKRFLWYCLYAWSVPAVITAATFSMQYFGNSLPDLWQPIVPQLGKYNCFFEQRSNVIAFLVWFTLPIVIIIACNLVLYIKTIRYCYKVKGEIEKMKDSQANKNERKKIISADTERMKMAVKLFLLMGISWLFESISICTIPVPAKGAPQVIQLIFDTFNCLQGVFIFCIFILKTKFIRALQKKFGMKYLRRSSQSTTSGLTVTTYALPASKV